MEEEKKEELIEQDFLLDISDEEEIYTLECLGNKKRPVEKQMRVYIKPLSGKDLAQISSRIRKDITNYKKDHPEDDRTFMELYNMFSEYWEFVYRVDKIENFFYKYKGETKEITDIADLYTFKNSKMAIAVSDLRMKFMRMDTLDTKN
jgi:hypothetical protein